jgi:hypothetical protein
MREPAGERNTGVLAPGATVPVAGTDFEEHAMPKWNYDSAHPARRCGHRYCTSCKTRRGRNRGNRNARHAVRAALHLVRSLL